MPPRMAPAGFAPPRPEEPQSALPPAEITTHDLNVRRAWLEQFDATAKAELVRKREQFAALTADEQAKIRTLDGQLQRERQADELRKVMYDYYHWVRGLPLYERMALEDLARRRACAHVAELRQDEFYRQVREVLPDEQKFRRFQELVKGSPYSGKDMQELLPGDEPGFRAWLDAYIRPRRRKTTTISWPAALTTTVRRSRRRSKVSIPNGGRKCRISCGGCGRGARIAANRCS